LGESPAPHAFPSRAAAAGHLSMRLGLSPQQLLSSSPAPPQSLSLLSLQPLFCIVQFSFVYQLQPSSFPRHLFVTLPIFLLLLQLFILCFLFRCNQQPPANDFSFQLGT